jgi:hypothetical protein
MGHPADSLSVTPASASSVARAKPMPDVPPMTTAVRDARLRVDLAMNLRIAQSD